MPLLLNEQPVEVIGFPGGEMHVTIDEDVIGDENMIRADIKSSDDIMTLHLVVDAIRRLYIDASIHLFMPYFPYSRQDRVCNEGEALSAVVMARMINNLEFDGVITVDDHSDVVAAALERHVMMPVDSVVEGFDDFIASFIQKDYVFVSPDAGANKKTLKIARQFEAEMVRADKVRDTKTGRITGTEVFGDVEGKTCVIVDDICDGGRTFIELAKALKEKGSEEVILYVTHGIFSRGVAPLYEYIDEIFTTDSLGNKSSEMLTVYEL